MQTRNTSAVLDPEYVKVNEIKPALSGYLRQSMELLSGDIVPDDRVVHDVRVHMKRARAILRLVSQGLDYCNVRKEIAALKEVGRRMSGLRESSVHRRNLRMLRKQHPQLFSALEDNEKIGIMMQKPQIVSADAEFMARGIPEIIEMLRKSGFRIRFYQVGSISPMTLLRSLDSTYNKLVNIYLIGRNDPSPEHLHELRKRSKDFLYQLSFFRPVDARHIKAMEKKLDSLTRNLGHYNDLAQLIKALDYRFVPGCTPTALDEIVVIIRNMQDKCLEKIWPAAYKLFSPRRKLINMPAFRLVET